MGAVAARAAHDLRSRWRSWATLAAVAGILGGAVVGVLAGARQTEGAYASFLTSQRAFQQFMFTFDLYPGTASVSVADLRSLPAVETVTPGRVFDGTPSIVMRGSSDTRLDHSLNAVNVLDGRLPDPDEPHEILVPVMLAEQEGLTVGSIRSFRLTSEFGEPGPRIDATVVGIGIAPSEFPPDNDIGTTAWAHVTPAFVERYARFGAPFAYVFLREADAGLDAFQQQLEAITEGAPVIGFQQASLTKNVQRAFRLQAVSLLLLGAMLGAATLALVAQTISRLTWQAARDHAMLSALGMTGRQLFLVGMLRVAAATGAATVVAVVAVVAISPLMPTGRARLAVIDPGVIVDLPVMLLGMGCLATLMLGATVIPALRAARIAPSLHGADVRTSVVADSLQRLGVPPHATLGVRFAFEPGARERSAAMRATVLSTVIAVGAIALTLSFGASLDHLLRTPRLYGATYHLLGQAIDTATPADGEDLLARLRAMPDVEAAAAGAVGFPFRVNGVLADGLALDPDDTAFLPPLLSGRYPAEPREILLGPGTLRVIGRDLGDQVEVGALGTATRPYTIVGTGVVPSVGHSANLGEGSLVGMETVRELFPSDGGLDSVLIKLRPGVEPRSAIPVIEREARPILWRIDEPLQPGDLVNFGGQRRLPAVLAAILAAIAVLSIGHGLLSSIPRRRRDIAVLRAAGFTTRQARRTVAWQASCVAIVGLAIGLPLGAAAGQVLWLEYAERLGVMPEARIPVGLLLATVPVTLLLARSVAWWPARRAGRIVPAVILRTE